MAVSDSYLEFVLDQLRDIEGVTSRRMFGGAGLYARGLFFGILADDALYLKVDEDNRPDFVGAGMKPFRPFADRPMTMQYYLVPASVLESPARLAEWAQRSLAAAERAREKKSRKTGRPRRGL